MQVRVVDDVIASLRAGSMKPTRIVASTTPGTYLLPQIVARFLQQHADAHIEIEVVSMANLWEEFASGAYDFALSPGLPFVGSARVEQMYVDPVLFFAAPGHRLSADLRMSFDDLRQEQLRSSPIRTGCAFTAISRSAGTRFRKAST